MVDVQARSELFKRQRRFPEALTKARSADLHTVAPVLAAVVVRIKEIHPHLTVRVQRNPENGNCMPANEAGGAVGNRDTGRLRVNQWLVAVVVRVVTGVEVADKAFEVGQFSGGHVDVDGKAPASGPTMKFRVNPLMGVAFTAYA